MYSIITLLSDENSKISGLYLVHLNIWYLNLVYTNMNGTFSVHAWWWYGYFITFSDDYSRFGYVHRKSDALETFIEFKVGSDNLLGLHTNLLWLDQGDMSSKFDSLLYWKMEKWKKKYQT